MMSKVGHKEPLRNTTLWFRLSITTGAIIGSCVVHTQVLRTCTFDYKCSSNHI